MEPGRTDEELPPPASGSDLPSAFTGADGRREVPDFRLPPPVPPAAAPPPPPAPSLSHAAPVPRLAPSRPLRPGELSGGWRAVFLIGWSGVIIAFVAVLNSSRTLGLSAWWLGPQSAPRLFLLHALPFLPAVIAIVLAARNARYVPWAGVVAALATAAVATGDIGRFSRLAMVELGIAGAGLAISLATFAGMARR